VRPSVIIVVPPSPSKYGGAALPTATIILEPNGRRTTPLNATLEPFDSAASNADAQVEVHMLLATMLVLVAAVMYI
jgi:hypothetical protein